MLPWFVSRARIPDWPKDFVAEQAGLVADTAIPLVLHWNWWVHRRVESIEFLDERRIRRSVSVDFTVPSVAARQARDFPGGLVVLPLALLRKHVLRRFDLRDEGGASLPVLTAEQNGTVALQMLWSLAMLTDSQTAQGQWFIDLLDSIANAPNPRAGQAALTDLINARTSVQHIVNDVRFSPLVHELSHSFLLFAAFQARPAERRILKFSYEEQVPAEGTNLFTFALPAVSTAASYHVELEAPDQVIVAHSWVSLDPEDAGEVPEIENYVPRTHFRLGPLPRGTEATLHAELVFHEASTLGVVCMLVLITVVLFSAGVFARFSLGVHPQRDAISAVVVVLPALLATYFFQSGEHRLATRMFVGLRRMIGGMSACCFFAAAALTVDLPDWWRTGIWCFATLLALVVMFRAMLMWARVRLRL